MKILLTGATGYIGRRLQARLLCEKEVDLRVLVRDARRLSVSSGCQVDVVEGDFFDENVLRNAVKGVDVVYYPIRFFGAIFDFTDLDRTYVQKFMDICIEAGVSRIIYVSFPVSEGASNPILRNMKASGEILSSSPEKIRCVWIRTGALIGAGSVFFEIVNSMIEKVPLIFLPPWMKKEVYAVAVEDVLQCLVRSRDIPNGKNIVLDIYGHKITFGQMLREAAALAKQERLFIPFPVSARQVSAFFMMLITPFSFHLALLIIRIVLSEEITPEQMPDGDASRLFPSLSLMSFGEAWVTALEETNNKEVMSRWIDSMENISYTSSEDDISKSIYHDKREMSFGDVPPEKIFRAIMSIGGESGWFTFDFLWRLRGLLDKLLGGYGTSLGRRTDDELRIGDTLNVWKVVDIEENRLLLLEAQMKVAGKAWLEFKIAGNRLIQTAYYYPRGIVGKIYWYSVLPFHFLVFRDLISNIIKHAKGLE